MLDIEAAGRREERAQQHRGWLAWHIGALSKMSGKKFPKLKDLIGFKRDAPKRQTVDEMIAIAEAWKARLTPKPKAGARPKP